MKKFLLITISLATASIIHANAQQPLAVQIAVEIERVRQQVEAEDAYWSKRGYVREGNVYRNIYSNQGRNTADINRERCIGESQRPDPVKEAEAARQARLAADPWGPGGQFDNRLKLTPEAKLASQGNTAANQWAQARGVR
jgi:hypothetical protein